MSLARVERSKQEAQAKKILSGKARSVDATEAKHVLAGGVGGASIDIPADDIPGWLPQRTRTRALLAAEANAPLALYRVIRSARGGQEAMIPGGGVPGGVDAGTARAQGAAQAGGSSGEASGGRLAGRGGEPPAGIARDTGRARLDDRAAARASSGSLSLGEVAVRAAIESHADMWERVIATREAAFEPLKRERRAKVNRPRG
jgi:hypothetical protein